MDKSVRGLPKALTGVPHLLRMMKSKDQRTRVDAVELIGKMGSKGVTTVPRLIAALSDRKETVSVAWAATVALAKIGPEAKAAIKHLIAVLDDESAKVNLRQSSVIALGKIDPKGREVLPALIRCLDIFDSTMAIGAAVALEQIGSDARLAIPALEQRLKRTTHPGLRQYLQKALKAVRQTDPNTPQ